MKHYLDEVLLSVSVSSLLAGVAQMLEAGSANYLLTLVGVLGIFFYSLRMKAISVHQTREKQLERFKRQSEKEAILQELAEIKRSIETEKLNANEKS